MSGVEFIVGTVLASIPLALEAYDRVGRVSEVFTVFRHYSREVILFEAKLGAQRTIFRNNAINLLTAITKNRPKVQEVMNRPSSQLARRDLAMASDYQNRIDALEESFVACRRTADQVHHNLQLLCLQCESFRTEMDDKQKQTGASEWLQRVRSRLKLGLNKPQIKSSIEELREFNRDFGSITEQITRALQDVINENRSAPVRKAARSLNILQRYHRTRYASKLLYSTLEMRWACSLHSRHSFDVRIINDFEPENDKTRVPNAKFVTCELSITDDDLVRLSKEPIRLEIQQAWGDDCEDPDIEQTVKDNTDAELDKLTAVLETNLTQLRPSNPTSTAANPPQGLVRGLKATAGIPAPSPPAVHESHAELDTDSPRSTLSTIHCASDLSLIDDFCKQLMEAGIDTHKRSLFGSLGRPHAQSQWFRLPRMPQPAAVISKSLAEIIQWTAEDPVLHSLPRLTRIDLAGNVAEGIMQFYSTPWLIPTNLGQNVRYIDVENLSSGTACLRGPYFMARLDSPWAKGKGTRDVVPTSSNHAIGVDYTEARNKLLFNFGILLLEIGFGRPWLELKQTVVSKLAPAGTRLSDYRSAEKLAQLLVNQMGQTYPRIIRKCLGCDFGLGETDLDNEELQQRFLEDVVSGLRLLREQMNQINVL